jgi:hypothetical protein
LGPSDRLPFIFVLYILADLLGALGFFQAPHTTAYSLPNGF